MSVILNALSLLRSIEQTWQKEMLNVFLKNLLFHRRREKTKRDLRHHFKYQYSDPKRMRCMIFNRICPTKWIEIIPNHSYCTLNFLFTLFKCHKSTKKKCYQITWISYFSISNSNKWACWAAQFSLKSKRNSNCMSDGTDACVAKRHQSYERPHVCPDATDTGLDKMFAVWRDVTLNYIKRHALPRDVTERRISLLWCDVPSHHFAPTTVPRYVPWRPVHLCGVMGRLIKSHITSRYGPQLEHVLSLHITRHLCDDVWRHITSHAEDGPRDFTSPHVAQL